MTGALYREFRYIGKSCHFEYAPDPTHSTIERSYARLPQLKMYCGNDKCRHETLWDADSDTVYFGTKYVEERQYTCRNCGKSKAFYLFVWQVLKDFNVFVKVGQWPALTIEPSPSLARVLSPEDSALYKKALTNANFGYGIGAVAYFRRVLENKINELLDLIVEAAQSEKLGTDEVQRIAQIKNSHRVEDKIHAASLILPAHLRPGGHNPLDKLYGPLSAGLHGESDDECLTIFTDAKFVLEYLFKNLTTSNEEARKYVKHLSAKAPVRDAPQPATTSDTSLGKR